MKKILAFILALTLAMSMGTMAAFAATTYPTDVSVVMTPYVYKDKRMVPPSSTDQAPGKTFYFEIQNNGSNSGGAYIRSTSMLKYYNFKSKVTEGSKFVSSVSLVAKKDGSDSKTYIAVATTPQYSTSSIDITVEFYLSGKRVSSDFGNAMVDGKTETWEDEWNITLESAVTEATGYTTVNDDAPIVNFDEIDDSEPIELYFGDNSDEVTFVVGAKGQGELYLKYSDDPTGTKYDLDSKYSNADLEYHLWDGTKKTFRRTGKLYIPAASLSNGKAPYLYQISSSGALTQVKAKYDSNEEQFVIDTATLNNYVVSDIALSASSSSNNNTTPSTPSETPQPNTGSGNSSSSTTSSNATEIANQVAQKIKTAKANGTAKPSVDLTVQNEESISAKDLQAIVTAAKNAGGSVRVIADTVSGGSTLGRLYIVPVSSAAVKNDIKYGVYTDSDSISSTKNMFEKYYNNNVAVIRLAQNTTYGLPVSIAAKVDLSGINTKTLRLYSYDRASGKYYAITNSGAWVDTAGFLHFNTTLAGDIVITDKALAAK